MSFVTDPLASSPSASPRLDGAAEPCPAPLNWQQVLEQASHDAVRWELTAADGSSIQGWTLGVGPPLYFLNGLVGDSRLFALTAFLLRDSFRCVLWDWPGGGASRRTLDEYANDLLLVADSQRDDRFPLLATGWGGLVALQAAAEFPDRVSRLILQGCSPQRRLSRLERWLLRMAAWCPGTLGRCPGFRRVQTLNHASWFPPFDQSRLHFLLENLGGTPFADFACRALLMHRSDLRDRLPEIRQPILAVQTEGEGRLEQAGHAQLAAGLPDLRSESLHTCGLLPHLTHPHRYRKLIEAFLLEGSPK